MKHYPIYRKIVIISIILIFLISFISYLIVSYKTKNAFTNILLSVEKLDSSNLSSQILEESVHSSILNDTVKNTKNYTPLISDIRSALTEINALKIHIFDANTITFLVSFSSAILLTIVLSMLDKINKSNQKIRDITNQINSTQNTQKIYTRIHCAYSESIIARSLLIKDKYLVSEGVLNIIYHLNREIKSISNIIPQNIDIAKETFSINEDEKRKFIEAITDIMNSFDLKRINEVPKNVNATNSIKDLIDNANELKKRIQSIS